MIEAKQEHRMAVPAGNIGPAHFTALHDAAPSSYLWYDYRGGSRTMVQLKPSLTVFKITPAEALSSPTAMQSVVPAAHETPLRLKACGSLTLVQVCPPLDVLSTAPQ
jgi:hypothetical protein